MKILVINNDGGGFADYLDVSDGTTVQQIFEQQIPDAKPDRYLIRVNRMSRQGMLFSKRIQLLVRHDFDFCFVDFRMVEFQVFCEKRVRRRAFGRSVIMFFIREVRVFDTGLRVKQTVDALNIWKIDGGIEFRVVIAVGNQQLRPWRERGCNFHIVRGVRRSHVNR